MQDCCDHSVQKSQGHVNIRLRFQQKQLVKQKVDLQISRSKRVLSQQHTLITLLLDKKINIQMDSGVHASLQTKTDS
jgi:hypothetical protein